MVWAPLLATENFNKFCKGEKTKTVNTVDDNEIQRAFEHLTDVSHQVHASLIIIKTHNIKFKIMFSTFK